MSAPTYAPPGYPPAQPQYPATAPGPAYPPQYAPPAAPAYPAQPYPQQYGAPPAPGYPPVQMAAPPQPLATGSLDDFFNQPSAGGGKSLAFEVGTTYVFIVPRPLGQGDVQQQTNRQGTPQYFKDGRPKFVMKVPAQMQPSPAFPDGLGTWFVKGQARDELVRAMAEAGAPAGPPESHAIIQVTCVGERPIPGYSPAKQFAVVYTRPNGAAPAAAAPVQAAPPAAPVAYAAPPQPAAPQQYAPPPAPQQSAPVAMAPAQAPAPPADLSQEQQALLAKLTGSPAG